MKHKPYSISIILIMATMFVLSSVKAQDQCISDVMKYIDRSAEGNLRPKKGQAFFMHYISENVPHQKFRSPVIKKEYKVSITPTQTIVESDDISIYKDQVDLFAVVHPLKQVIWNKAAPGPQVTTTGIKEMANMQKEILTSGEVIQCQTIGSGEDKFKKVELIPSKTYRDQYHITSMMIMFDVSMEMIKKVVISFEEDQDVITQIVTYQEINYNYRDFKPVTGKKQFLDKDGNLNKKYPGYTLVKN